MRDWTRWAQPLIRSFRLLRSEAITHVDNFERFLQIELGLWLLEHLLPGSACDELPAALTGYPSELVASLEARRACAIARHRLRYLRTAAAWSRWLRWYAETPAELRLYEVDLESGRFQRREGGIVIAERMEAYEAALATPPPHLRLIPAPATAGQYTFKINGDDVSVMIPSDFAPLDVPDSPEEPPPLRPRPPITIEWEALRESARALSTLDPGGNWLELFERLQFSLLQGDELVAVPAFTLDGFFHLVGMVGSGKSTLIKIMLHHLVVVRGLHVTVMCNTVTESLALASDLRRWGIAAAPALGTDRAAHRRKYGQAKQRTLSLQDVLDTGNCPDPALAWLTAPCALSGLLPEGGPIPAGEEPCTRLEKDGQLFHCPIRPVCPVHQASRDLATSRVWIVNPAAFTVTGAPESISRSRMRLAEAIYRVSDVLIVDEVDRVQVQLDRRFTPVDDLAGQKGAMLEFLSLILATAMNEQGRRQVKDPRTKQIAMYSGEANRHASWLIHMLSNNDDLAEWLGRYPLTNITIYLQLSDELARRTDDGPIDEELKESLFQLFKQFVDNVDSPQASVLAEIANDTRREDEGEARLLERLRAWVAGQVPYDLTTRADMDRLIRRLAFAVILSSMDRRVDALLRDWIWAAPRFGERRQLDQSPPKEYIDLCPESPLGNLLGYQYVQRDDGTGALKYIQAYGVGRWLLLQFHNLYADLDGVTGPHVFATSATSWMPGSPQFHLGVTPHAVLRAPADELAAINQSTFEILTVPDEAGSAIRISGIQGAARISNLERIVRYLASSADAGGSVLERELRYWANQGEPRKVLLLVGSYVEAHAAVSVLQGMPRWQDRAVALIPDDDGALDSSLVRRGEIETLRHARPDVDVVIAPLLAIERGFNILDEHGGALLGSAFFLVRPIPSPEDLGRHLLAVNSWIMRRLDEYGGVLPAVDGSQIASMRDLRLEANRIWHDRLRRAYHGLESLSPQAYAEMRDSMFVIVWQTIGRLVRRGRRARVFFVDAAFSPSRGRHLLRDWRDMLAEYLSQESTKPGAERLLAHVLYEPAYRAFSSMEN